MRKHQLTTIGVLGCLITCCATAFGDFECKGSISYKWKGEKDEAESEVFVVGAVATGADEAKGKAALTERLAFEQPRAMSECQRAHENFANCMSTKYEKLGPVLNSAGFASRKALEESISTDCNRALGKCTGVKFSEIQCQEKATPGAAAAASPSPEGEKKEEKKKK